MKPRVLLACLVLVPGLALAQTPGRAQVGICVDPDRFEAAQAAGFDYVETNASRVAALSDEEFERG